MGYRQELIADFTNRRSNERCLLQIRRVYDTIPISVMASSLRFLTYSLFYTIKTKAAYHRKSPNYCKRYFHRSMRSFGFFHDLITCSSFYGQTFVLFQSTSS
ncbi:hypothetical protein BDFB_013375 [Asbolus verrucosus]|uniref:Uncharacterized protein n=1 Tax=Asbolus verrucosus TaxID=1661398 RepID=A0A482VTR6_ASBVE|nr:hypothetical protein BDFB_013375 [Asbolus verrucosus]